jgi:hypothetical protein
MVHAVHNGISARIQEGRALNQEGEKIKEAFPTFAHSELFVRSIAVIEKGLAEK